MDMTDSTPALSEHDPTELSFVGLPTTGQLPRPADVRLTKWDCNQLAWSSVTTCTVLHGADVEVNVGRFREAFQRVVNKNPILAGRLVEQECVAEKRTETRPEPKAAAGESNGGASCGEAKNAFAGAEDGAQGGGRVVYISWPEGQQNGATFEVRKLEASQEARADAVLSSADAVVKYAVELKVGGGDLAT